MFTKDQLGALVSAQGRDGIIAAVNEVPEDELRNALVLVTSLYQRSTEMERELWEQEHLRCMELETELEKLKAR